MEVFQFCDIAVGREVMEMAPEAIAFLPRALIGSSSGTQFANYFFLRPALLTDCLGDQRNQRFW
jgi:hypothetical protein